MLDSVKKHNDLVKRIEELQELLGEVNEEVLEDFKLLNNKAAQENYHALLDSECKEKLLQIGKYKGFLDDFHSINKVTVTIPVTFGGKLPVGPERM